MVIVPTYNEAQNLPRLVSALIELPIEKFQILVVDDSSPDGTGQVADQLVDASGGRVRVLHRNGKRSFGASYLDGFRAALKTDVEAIAQMDADLSHPPELLPAMLEALDSYDVVIGSRYVQGGAVDRHWPSWRKTLSSFGNFYARTLLTLPIQDTTSGFRVWRRKALANIPLERVRSNGYAFLIEMIYLAHWLGYSIKEIPFYFPDREMGQSKMSLTIQLEAAASVWKILWDYRDIISAGKHD